MLTCAVLCAKGSVCFSLQMCSAVRFPLQHTNSTAGRQPNALQLHLHTPYYTSSLAVPGGSIFFKEEDLLAIDLVLSINLVCVAFVHTIGSQLMHYAGHVPTPH
jgi:hypothetical protein